MYHQFYNLPLITNVGEKKTMAKTDRSAAHRALCLHSCQFFIRKFPAELHIKQDHPKA